MRTGKLVEVISKLMISGGILFTLLGVARLIM